MKRRGVLLACAAAAAVGIGGCASAPPSSNATASRKQPLAVPDATVGWMQGDCLAIKNDHLMPGTPLQVIPVAQGPADAGRAIAGTVIGAATSGEHCPALLGDRQTVNTASGYSHYQVKLQPSVQLAIGVIGTRLDAPWIDRSTVFSQCSTGEGVRFDIRTGGHVRWQGYDYLGYDTEVTCID